MISVPLLFFHLSNYVGFGSAISLDSQLSAYKLLLTWNRIKLMRGMVVNKMAPISIFANFFVRWENNEKWAKSSLFGIGARINLV